MKWVLCICFHDISGYTKSKNMYFLFLNTTMKRKSWRKQQISNHNTACAKYTVNAGFFRVSVDSNCQMLLWNYLKLSFAFLSLSSKAVQLNPNIYITRLYKNIERLENENITCLKFQIKPACDASSARFGSSNLLQMRWKHMVAFDMGLVYNTNCRTLPLRFSRWEIKHVIEN